MSRAHRLNNKTFRSQNKPATKRKSPNTKDIVGFTGAGANNDNCAISFVLAIGEGGLQDTHRRTDTHVLTQDFNTA